MTNEEFDKELELALDYSTEPWADIACVSSAFVQHVATLGAQLAAVTADRDSLRQQCEAMATEIDAKQRELDEVKARLEEATGWINVNFSTGEWTA